MSLPSLAYVFIDCKTGKDGEVMETLKDFKDDIYEEGFEIKSYQVYGIHDIIVEMKGPPETLKDTIITKIRRIKGIENTVTLFAYG
jgi:hypothetical protein